MAAATTAFSQAGTAHQSEREHEQDYEHPPSVAAATSGAAAEQEKKQKYTCPMHPEVVMDHPGNCPKCGMKLEPMKSKTHETHRTHAAHETHETHTPHELHRHMSMRRDALELGRRFYAEPSKAFAKRISIFVNKRKV